MKMIVGIKATVRRFSAIERSNTSGRIKPFKIKEIFPQQKTSNIKKTEK